MQPRLDIVIPLHNEQANMEQLVERLKSTLTAVDLRWRVIFVDDGSTDGSDVALRLLCADDPGFSLVTLSRNFGHMAAVQAGLDHSDADAVVLLDGDLQDPPEYIPALVAAWRAGAKLAPLLMWPTLCGTPYCISSRGMAARGASAASTCSFSLRSWPSS